MDSKIRLRLKSLITPAMEKKYLPYFEKQASFLGNGVYTIASLYSTDTRELFLMFCAQQEQIDYETEPSKPEMLADDKMDLTGLKKTLQSCIDEMWGDDYCEDNDDASYVYEEALKAFFGEDIWERIDKQTP